MRIRLRFALVTALVVAIAVSVSSGIIARCVNRSLREMAARRVIVEAKRIADISRPLLAARDRAALDRIVQAAAKTTDIARVCVADNEGIVLADSMRQANGRLLPQARKSALKGAQIVGPVGALTTAVSPVVDSSRGRIGAAIVTVRMARVERAARSVRNVALAAGGGAALIGLALAYLFAAYLVAPLSALLAAIRRVASGDLESRVLPPANPPELREMGQAFNDMALAVTRRVRNLELLNLMSAEVSMARRMSDIAKAVRNTCATVLEADARLWVFDPMGETLRSIPIPGVQSRITARPTCPVTRAARGSRPIIIGDGGDLPSGSRVSEVLPPTDAAVIVPLTAPEAVIGALSVEAPAGRRSMTREQVSIVIAMANIVGPAIGALRRMKSQVQSARMLQSILVPQSPPAIPGIETAARYEPAEEIGRMGGDYYDFIRLQNDNWCFAVGDVSGKGLPAAQYTAMAKYVLRSYLLEYRSLLQALAQTNTALVAQMGGETFITLFCGILDTRALRLRYARAGHPPPLLYSRQTGSVRQLASSGPPVGIFEDAVFEENEESLVPGDVLLLFTDGLSEARAHTSAEMFGEDRIMASLEHYADLPAWEIANSIIQDAKSFAGGKLRDDAAIVVVKVQ